MKKLFGKNLAVALIVAFAIATVIVPSNVVYASEVVTDAESPEVLALQNYIGNTADFNAYFYYINNADIQALIGADGDALLKHYNEVGKNEGRIAVDISANKSKSTVSSGSQSSEFTYVLNNSTMKFHSPGCRDVKKISTQNYGTSSLTRDELIAGGYSPCGHCNP